MVDERRIKAEWAAEQIQREFRRLGITEYAHDMRRFLELHGVRPTQQQPKTVDDSAAMAEVLSAARQKREAQ